MKLFITWSGETSKAIATALRLWIPTLIQNVEAFMSDTDIEKGTRWEKDIALRLDEATMGIICLTPDNINARWVLFEAGALAKKASASEPRVCTYLYQLSPTDIEPPLSMFQHTAATRDDTRRLIFDIRRFASSTVPEAGLSQLFDSMWPKLEATLRDVPVPKEAPHRETKDMMQETLEIIRGLAQELHPMRRIEVMLDQLVANWSTPGFYQFGQVSAQDLMVPGRVNAPGATGSIGPAFTGPSIVAQWPSEIPPRR